MPRTMKPTEEVEEVEEPKVEPKGEPKGEETVTLRAIGRIGMFRRNIAHNEVFEVTVEEMNALPSSCYEKI